MAARAVSKPFGTEWRTPNGRSARMVTKVPPEKLELLNDAYEAFNNTAAERKAVVKNVKDECEITLS